ncbi:MAG: triple tyrosine motif-containing protein [Ferruginibacter sp.]
MKRLPLLLLLVFYLKSGAQNTIGLPQIINFNNDIFQGGTQTWDMRQDAEGRMYFANNEGLITYDGSYWKTYPQPNESMLRSIALDQNRIYAGGQDELGFYAPDEHGILQYTSLKKLIPKQYNTFTDVWETEAFKGSVFFRTWDRIFEYKNDAIQTYPAKIGWHIMKRTGNRLIAQDKQEGLFEFINSGWQPLGPMSAAPKFEVTGIVALGNDSLLLSSLHDGLYIYHEGILEKKITKAENSFIKNQVYTFERINDSEFVAGTTSEGCIVINADGEVMQQLGRPEGLQNNNVLSVFLDKDHNLWTGLDNGISFIAYNSAIKYIKPAKPDELSGYSARVYDNNLYVATSDGAYVAPLSNAAKDFSFSKGDFIKLSNTGGQTWRFDEVNHQLLMGHHRGSFLIRKKEAIQLTAGSGAWIFLPTSSVSPAKNILAGTYGGLTMLEYANNNFVSRGGIKGMNESLRFLTIDNNDIVWASHPYRGIYKIILAPDGRSFNYTLFTEKDGLPSTLRNTVFRVKNRVVFATEHGVYEFDAEKKRFKQSPLLYSLFGNTIIQYLNEDADGNIWFCSGKKVGVVSFAGEKNIPKLTYFSELTGKILSGFESIYPYDKENIFIASTAGIIHLNYRKYIIENVKPGILLTHVKLLGKTDSLIFGGYFQPANGVAGSPAGNAVLHFPNGHNSFQFEFSSPAFGLQNNIDYSYQLAGYDRGWSARTSKTEKEYTNLPEGGYTFMVKAYDRLGNESQVVSYSFVINPAWYKTVWAYAFYTLFLLALIYTVYRWQKRKFSRQQLQFEEEQKRLKYIHQLEVEKNEKEIIQLQNEKLVNEMVFKNKELAGVSMHLVERSDALIKVKDELQRLHKKTGGNHDVKRAIQMVNEIEKNDSNWEQFAAHFDEINDDFIKKLKTKFPNLTSTDLKVCTYLQLKLTSKEIAQLINISVRGVEISRYRLRKKLQLSTGQTLNDFLSEIHIGKEET